MSSGSSSALSAVPITSRDLPAGPVLSLRAKIVACGVMTPSQPPDQTFGARAALEEHAAKGLVGKNTGEIIDAAMAFGLANHRDHLIGAEFAGRDQSLQAARILDGLQFDFCNFDRHSVETFSLNFVSSLRFIASAAGVRRAASFHSPRRGQ